MSEKCRDRSKWLKEWGEDTNRYKPGSHVWAGLEDNDFVELDVAEDENENDGSAYFMEKMAEGLPTIAVEVDEETVLTYYSFWYSPFSGKKTRMTGTQRAADSGRPARDHDTLSIIENGSIEVKRHHRYRELNEIFVAVPWNVTESHLKNVDVTWGSQVTFACRENAREDM